MFSSAFKSFISNISSNYEIAKQPVASSGAWQIFDAKKKSTGARVSVFVFERKSLDVHSTGLGARASATSIRKVQDEVVERLKKEASSLARLRHPSILQLVEPVEDTRSGGLMFATEPVVASLATVLSEKDDQERSTRVGGRPSRYIVQEPDGTKKRRDLEMDELEIQKGLLQVAKGLEFLHDSAKLVHGNLTPTAIFINAKSDWKISGLAFSGPPNGVDGAQSAPQISLSEVLHHDGRLPSSVQLNLDYTSPDFVLDTNVNISADIFSLGLVILAIYNSPHTSPIETHGSQSTYKKIFSSSSTTPSPSNDFLCSRPLPRDLVQTLPRLLARRPAQRITASEFQQSAYFDNILVNTIRFLEELPAKTANEKAQFMRGLSRVVPQFPVSVLGKKVLGVLLEELKDRELLALILQNVFTIIKTIPSGRLAFSEKVLPRLREVFLTKTKTEERDPGKEAGYMVILENIQVVIDNCSGKEFKDDILPIIHSGMESPTHPLVDASLQCVPSILPVLDFSTVKHDLFPVVASVFSKTSSLSIKVRGLEALGVLCGASSNGPSQSSDDLSGVVKDEQPNKASSSLDKFTMQEKVVPLLKGIKTKEPAVMMASLNVFQQIGRVADTDFVAMEVMPILWSFSLGPLLNLNQFKAYMDLIKSLSSKIEREQLRKLQDLSSADKPPTSRPADTAASLTNGALHKNETVGTEVDFERLVLGTRGEKNEVFAGALSTAEKLTPNPPTFSWSSKNTSNAPTTSSLQAFTALQPQPQPSSRSVTPDVSMSSLPVLQPALQPVPNTSASIWNIPSVTQPPTQNQHHTPLSSHLNPSSSLGNSPLQPSNHLANFAISPPTSNNPWHSQAPAPAPPVSFFPALAPPPPPLRSNSQMNVWQQQQQPSTGVSLAGGGNWRAGNGFSSSTPALVPSPASSQQPKTGLDKYQSLL